MRTWLIFICMLLSTASLAVPAWTWVDENGQQHFSDRPIPGARRVELVGAPAISLRRPAAAPAPLSATNSATAPTPARLYTTFAVTSPAEQQTLWNIEGSLDVLVELAPALRPGHRLDAYLDGRRITFDRAGPQFTVPDVYRGLHTLLAVIVNERGEEVLRSPPVTFMVRQTSILNPNNPQNHR
ncbi:DUF4124 domain-containing protein [Candidatus Rariloculus sp.]|uniref:DUF4124 domain-containing protein n=1 Tax=Candidatus Rariloculus sp. TaxID=3101265 RepID=UPI003D0FA369